MVDLERVERAGSGCLWLTLLAFPLLAAVIFLATVGVQGLARAGWGYVLAGAVAMVVGCLLLGSLVSWMTILRKRGPEVRTLLDGLQARFGGVVSLPTVLHPIAAPRLKLELGGLAGQVFLQRITRRRGGLIVAHLLESDQARLGSGSLRSSFTLRARLDLPTTHTFVAMTRTRLSGVGADLAGMKEVSWGDPELDQRFAVFSNQPEQAAGVVADPSYRERLLAALTSNPPFLTRLDFGRYGATWMTVASTKTDVEVVAAALQTVHVVAQRLADPGDQA